MAYAVLLTAGAERDLAEIVDYIAEFDSAANANRVLDKLVGVAESLAELPERGSHPRELLTLGIREFRQLFFKPYRLIYSVTGNTVHVHLIADRRRDMQALLQRRLIADL